MSHTYIGASVVRREDPRLLMGRGRFVDDLVLPDMLHMAVCRSPHAHARIRMVHLEAAQQSDGVVTAWSSCRYCPAGTPFSDVSLPPGTQGEDV